MDSINLLCMALPHLGGAFLLACTLAMVPAVYRRQVSQTWEVLRDFWFEHKGKGREYGFHGNRSRTYGPALQPNIRSPPKKRLNTQDLFWFLIEKLMNYGEVIKRARKSAGITQQELAEKVHLTRNYIALVETNKRVPSVPNFLKICDALNISNDEFSVSAQIAKDIQAIFEKYGMEEVMKELEKLIKNEQKDN
jgi:transcriptional regulator with XRE-family HTH domain